MYSMVQHLSCFIYNPEGGPYKEKPRNLLRGLCCIVLDLVYSTVQNASPQSEALVSRLIPFGDCM